MQDLFFKTGEAKQHGLGRLDFSDLVRDLRVRCGVCAFMFLSVYTFVCSLCVLCI